LYFIIVLNWHPLKCQLPQVKGANLSAVNLQDLVLDRTSSISLSQQLTLQLSQWMVSGRLAPGTRLPASRVLAQDLKLSRNTISTAIEQLRAQGYLTSQAGNGVFVSMDLPQKDKPLLHTAIQGLKKYPPLSNYGEQLQKNNFKERSGQLPFTPGVPDLNAFPYKIWQTLLRRHSDRAVLGGYQSNQGYQPLRENLAQYLNSSRGLRCTPEQIIITQGAQQGLALCTQLLLNPGDQVLHEEPGYMGARKAFTAIGANINPLIMSPNGLDVSQLPSETTAKLLYTTPTHQYPMGGILPASDRLQLLNWADKHRLWIIEDDYDSEFHFYTNPIAAMQGMSEQSPVIYLGSFSKTLQPGLRLGYLVVPKPLVSAFVQAKSFICGESPSLSQAVVSDFIEEGHFIRHLRRMRLNYQKKWEHMQSLCEQYLHNTMTPIAQSAGMHLVLESNDSKLDDVQLHQRFSQAGFGSSPLSYYYQGEVKRRGLVLGFSNTNEQERKKGIQALATLL
jgi:GntR family transcriptional regulator/MocR family aminotransferase